MSTLFNIEPAYPTGFAYVPDFITEEDEVMLCEEITRIELHNFNFQGYQANRKVASFGYDYSFNNGQLTRGADIPAAFYPLVDKVARYLAVETEEFAELLVTEYPPGAVINWHRDAPPFDMIAGISLMADCTFRLRPHDKAKQSRSSIISFPVQRRSLYIMRDISRSDWQHSIAPLKQKRYSITLRTLK